MEHAEQLEARSELLGPGMQCLLKPVEKARE